MIKKYLNRVFIDGLSGMALGLFATLIIGTIFCQIGTICGNNYFGNHITRIGIVAKTLMGAGIGIGVAVKLKASPLTSVSAAVCGMIGAFPALAQGYILNADGKLTDLLNVYKVGDPGEPLAAFVAAYVAIEIGSLISGKTKLEIILTPLGCITAGAFVAFLIGPYISQAMSWIGYMIDVFAKTHPITCGIVVSVIMGMLLTLPISSAAIGFSIGLNGIAAGAATIGCCCNMVGFAVISYRENKVGGLLSQGIGTSMLQVPNIMKNPLIWLPSIISSAILGPISSAVLKMVSNPAGSGMGSAGLVGQFMSYETMVNEGFSPAVTIIEIITMQFVLPAVLCLLISEAMRKLKLIKPGDLKLPDASHA